MKILVQRKSIRFRNYDYSSRGFYFVTICAQNREELFGYINNGKMMLNDRGEMIDEWYLKIPKRFDNIELDEYQIMPNHLHGIIVIENGRTHGSSPTDRISPTVGADQCVDPNPWIDPKPSLGKIIQWFKTMTTNYYIRGIKNKKWEPFHKRLWQRNYYENIIRVRVDPCIDPNLNKIRQYIKINPEIWSRDRNNPINWKNNL